MLTQARVRELFDYDPISGRVIRKITRGCAGAGTIVGSLNRGYLGVCVDKKFYKLHRIIFLWMTGKFPPEHIGHENHIKTDNWWENICEVTQQENNKNVPLRKDNSSGVCGVYLHKSSGRWRAMIGVCGKAYHLGYFADLKQAAVARKQAEEKFGFHENHGLQKGAKA